MQQARRWLDRPAAASALVAALACAVCMPSLWIGLVGDDYAHRSFILAHLHDLNPQGAWWNMFDGRGPVAALMFTGAQPWWTSPHLSVAFLRPLGTISHYLDYLLWPNSPALMHLHNVLLYAGIVLVAATLYRRILGVGAAFLLATLMYASDDAHISGTAWIASRNTLLTALFGFLALWFHDRARRDASMAARWFAPASLFLAHASSEGAFAIWGYLVAYAWFLDRAMPRSRILALLPLAIVSVGWAIAGASLDYGVRGSGAYLDPRTEPWLFLQSATTRLPDLMRVQFGLTDEIASQLPHLIMRPTQALVAALWLPAFLYGFRDTWKRPTARFFLVGCVIALLPLCAVGSISRLLYIAGLGAHGLAGELLATCLMRAANTHATRSQRTAIVTGSLPLVAHVLIAILAVPLGPGFWSGIHKNVYQAMKSLPAGSQLKDSTILILNTPDFLASSFVGLYRVHLGMPGPDVMHVLGVSTRRVRVTHVASNVVDLEPDGGYLADPTSILARRRDERFQNGQVFALHRVLVRVEETTPTGRPSRIRVLTLEQDAPKLLWMVWSSHEQRYAPLKLPAVGQTIVLAP